MNKTPNTTPDAPTPRAAKDWIKTLATYRDPSALRSSFELAVTVGPFILLWALAWYSLSYSYWLALDTDAL